MYTPSVTARCLQDTQQNKMVYSISVLAYFHTTPSGVVFLGQTYERHEFFGTSDKMPRAVFVFLPGRTLTSCPLQNSRYTHASAREASHRLFD